LGIYSIILVGVAVIYISVALFFYFFQELLLFRPTELADDYKFNFDFPFEERNFEMKDGAVINAIFIPAENERGVLLYFHGNTGSLERWGPIAKYFTQFGYSILIPDYRGYGKSTGVRSMQSFFNDALFLYQDLQKTYEENQIVIYGRSIGTGTASWLASQTKSKALILETPYFSVADITSIRLLFLPTSRILRFPFPSHRYLKSVETPIHIIHGTKDAVVSYSSGMKLYESIPNKTNVHFTTIQGGKHGDLATFEEFHSTIASILDDSKN
jgi:pimeloyl-ACP methyl ester carboxylesterase